jgi:NSS family neurotransmitter:Na+ symporter
VGVLLFLTIFFLGIDSAFFLAHGGVITPIKDKFGISGKKATMIICSLGFIVGILFTTKGGLYWLDIIDRATAFYGLLVTGAVASIVVGWKFGANNLRDHLNATSDIKVGPWWDWLLKIIVPAGLLFVAIYGGFMKDLASPYGGYPLWAASMIWVILVVTLILSFVFQSFKTKSPEKKEDE